MIACAVRRHPELRNSLPAGQGIGMVHELKPAAEVVRELGEGARRIIEGRLVERVRTTRT